MTRSIEVRQPGLLTTVQDLGRPGLMRHGFTPGGAIDRGALILGNRLVGNAPDAAGLEITLVGPHVQFLGDAVIAITGADLGARLNREAIPLWEPFAIRDGDELTFDPAQEGQFGARAYLCIAGGLELEPVMGSRGTDLFGRFGGVDGRALKAGDSLPLGEPSDTPDKLLRRTLAAPPPIQSTDEPFRVVTGPQLDRFTDTGVATFFGDAFTISSQSDRMGMRLTGPALSHSAGADLISEPIAHGAIQVPGDGQPIVLLAGRQTVGGYPKIATVIGADLDRFGQRRPGDGVRFVEVDRATARDAQVASLARLGDDAIVTSSVQNRGLTRLMDGGNPATPMTESDLDNLTGWDANGVTRLIQALDQASVAIFRLRIASLGVDLEWYREPTAEDFSNSRPATSGQSEDAPERSDTADGTAAKVAAPMLGVFYRRPAPDQPPFVEEGQAVSSGQQIGLIEVMKTYHEIVAPNDGTLTAFLVEDGHFVEFGQTIATIDASD